LLVMAQLAITPAFNILISVYGLSYLYHSHSLHYWLYVAMCVSRKLMSGLPEAVQHHHDCLVEGITACLIGF
jgi:hypothetical protein